MKVERVIPKPAEETYNILNLSRDDYKRITDAVYGYALKNQQLGNLGVSDKQMDLWNRLQKIDTVQL